MSSTLPSAVFWDEMDAFDDINPKYAAPRLKIRDLAKVADVDLIAGIPNVELLRFPKVVLKKSHVVGKESQAKAHQANDHL